MSKNKNKVTATLILTNFYVSPMMESEMWGVFSAFDLPIRPVSEWYTEEAAIAAAKIEEAAWLAKFKDTI